MNNYVKYIRDNSSRGCQCDECTNTRVALDTMSVDSRKRVFIHNFTIGPFTVCQLVSLLEVSAIQLTKLAVEGWFGSWIERVETARGIFESHAETKYVRNCDAWLAMAKPIVTCDACNGVGTIDDYVSFETSTNEWEEKRTDDCRECYGTGSRHFHYDYDRVDSPTGRSRLILVPKRPKWPAQANRNVVPDIDVGVDVGVFLGLLPPKLLAVAEW